MPIYTFRNIATGDDTEKIMKVDERELYLSDNPQMKQVITKAPGLGDSVLLGVTKTPDSFNSLLKQIHRNNRGSKIETR